MSTRVAELGEDGLIERITGSLSLDPSRVVVGPGDDCAVLRTADALIYQLQKVDCVVEGIHFLPETAPEKIGWKAMARAVSDIAAMGSLARPVSSMITIAFGRDRLVAEVDGWYEGMTRCADAYGFSLVGGETTSLPKGAPTMISVAMTGEVPVDNCVFRSGATIGDWIAVSGKLGGSFEGERHLDFKPRIGFGENLRPTAMMDLSDGLAKDLPRLAKASGVGYAVDFDSIPRHAGCDVRAAVSDGEDYELLMTFREKPPENDELTVIGRITETVETPLDGGWDHFKDS